MSRFDSTLPVHAYRGSVRACGRAYGEENRERVDGFLHLRGFLKRKNLRYAAQCWDVVKGWKKPLAEFVRGTAEGAGRRWRR